MKQHQERAKQFAPYAALRGFDAVVADRRTLREDRRELAEDECIRLSDLLFNLKKGDEVRLSCYRTDRYVNVEGVISSVDKTFRFLKINGEQIAFEDILEIAHKE